MANWLIVISSIFARTAISVGEPQSKQLDSHHALSLFYGKKPSQRVKGKKDPNVKAMEGYEEISMRV